MSSKKRKLVAAKVEKEQKRREEKETKKKLKLKLKLKEEQEKKDKEGRREKEGKILKKLEKKLQKELEKEQKKLKEQRKEHKRLEKKQKKLKKKLKKERKKERKNELKKSEKNKILPVSTESKGEEKNKHKQDHSEKGPKLNKAEQTSSNKKPKLENVKKHISVMTPSPSTPLSSIHKKDDDNSNSYVKKEFNYKVAKPAEVVAVPHTTAATISTPLTTAATIPTPVTPSATPVPQKTAITDNNSVRKPVSIRKPGASREINPIYTKPAVAFNNASNSSSSDFIIPGVNDTEESRILTRTFADKWYLPANLYKIEANIGLKYKRGRFSDSEKLLAMKLTTKFCQEQNMTLERFKTIFFDDMGTENGHQNRLSNFFVDASQHFGGRPVVAVYDFLKRLYHPGNHRGPWTPEEDQILLREFQKHGPKWALIGKELNRLGINCRDRYNIKWKHEGRVVKGPWIKEEDEKLMSAIKDSIEASGTISWLWISEERVKTRTPLRCLLRWKLMKCKEARDLNPINSSNVIKNIPTANANKTTAPKKSKETWGGWKEDEDYLLIHSILTTGANTDESIQWKSLNVPGVPTPRHNPELFFRRWNHLKIKAGIGNEAGNLKECVENVKKYLIGLSKSPAYIFSEDEEMDF